MALDFPMIYLLSTHLEQDELHDLEEQIGPKLTHDVDEAEVFVGKVTRRERALFELRRLHVPTMETPQPRPMAPPMETASHRDLIDGASSTASDTDVEVVQSEASQVRLQKGRSETGSSPVASPASAMVPALPGDHGLKIRVLRLSWFTDSVANGEILPQDGYIVYEGFRSKEVGTPSPLPKPMQTSKPKPTPKPTSKPSGIFGRAQADVLPSQSASAHAHPRWRPKRRHDHEDRNRTPAKRPALVHHTTSEHDAASHLPPIPEYLHSTYSCQRPTPVSPPNDKFIEELKKIRTTRILTGDKIGVRAYSSAIASLAAYPYTLTTPDEIARLPGCGPKFVVLYQEFKQTDSIREVQEAESDPKLKVLRLFYDVWGVAETTAREWYKRGWRDLDDVVEYGWQDLTRVQQIGVKYYDELLLKIPRREVEAIASVVLAHANRLRPGFQMVIVGGYRRGKLESGDVDMVLSHPDESATSGFIERLVVSLEGEGYITHTLTLSSKNSERGQEPLAWKGNDRRLAGTGFDTLDKALVVWQEPPGDDADNKKKKKEEPNPHRRVDIIISPWKTAGCAVLGWTSGTTFQRDLRRYCKRELSLKFDSSGVRSRLDGSWVDLEGGSDSRGRAPDMLTAERRVFEGLGLEWRPPEERCTG